jgi:hypothetical protein
MRPSLALVLALAGSACGGGDGDDGQWEVVLQGLDDNLLSIWGTSRDDVWAVGARGQVQRWDGAAWQRLDPGVAQTLWWVHGFAGGPIYLGGEGGTIVEYAGGQFRTMTTPATGPAVFGIWGASPDEVWAVGGNLGGGGGGFVWRLEDGAWVEAPGLPAEVADEVVWKAHGRAANDVWMVGTDGLALRWDGAGFRRESTGGESLFTVSSDGERFVAVGGLVTPLIAERRDGGWTTLSPLDEPFGLKGVVLSDACDDWAVGDYGYVLRDRGDGFKLAEHGLGPLEGLHGAWLDPDCGLWAVGGRQFNPYDGGVLVHFGAPLGGDPR